MKWTDKLALIAITLWVGALWAVGGIAAPTLFYHLADKMQAGNLAGQMFGLVAYIGMACGTYLIVHRLNKLLCPRIIVWFTTNLFFKDTVFIIVVHIGKCYAV